MRIIIFVFLSIVSLPGQARVYSLQEYVSRSVQKDETVKIVEAELKQAQWDLKAVQNLYDLTFSLKPEQSHSNQSFEQANLKIYERNTSISGLLTQETPWGMDIELSGFETIDDSDNVVGRTDSSWSLNLSQDLWQNSFGEQNRQKIEKAEWEVKRFEKERARTALKSCMEASKRYFEAYLSQEKWIVFTNLLKNAERVWKEARSSYRKKLLKKIDLLSANADFLDLKSKTEQASADYKNKRAVMFSFWTEGKDLGERLSLPNSDLFENLAKKVNWDDNLEIQALAAKLARDGVELKLQKRESKPTMQVDVEIGERNGQALVGGTLNDFEDQFLNLSLTWEWPFYSPSNHRKDIAKAKLGLEITKWEKGKKERDLKTNWEEFFRNLETDTLRQKSSAERIKIYQEQVKEADRLLKFGRIEIEDYLKFRDNLLQEELSRLDLQWNIWQAQMRISEIGNQVPKYCPKGY